MPAKSGKSQLLVVSRTENLAHTIQGELRRSGMAVSVHWPADSKAFADLLSRIDIDLVLTDEVVKTPSVEDVLHAARDFDPDLPVLVMGEHTGLMRVIGALDLGAKDFVSCQDLRHLTLVVNRELDAYVDRRRMHALHKRTQELEARTRSLLKDSGDAVLHAQDGIIIDANPALLGLLSHTTADDAVTGHTLLDLAAADDQATLKAALRRVSKSGTAEAEVRLVGRDGPTPPLQMDLSIKSVDGESLTEVLIRQSVLEQSYAPGGRADLFKRLDWIGDHGEDGTQALLLILIDHFDNLEERIGYLDSDEVLRGLFDLLAPFRRPGDRIYRFSTSELVMLVTRESVDAIRAFSDEIVSTVADAMFTTAEHETGITVTVASYPLSGDERPPTLVRDMRRHAADVSRRGGDVAVFMGPTAEASERKRIAEMQAQRVRDAIDNNRLTLVYQPIASLEGEPGLLFDTHIRLQPEDGPELAAADFLPIASEFGLMPDIDSWVVNAAIAAIGGADAEVKLFIRISNQTLADNAGFLRLLREAFEAGQCRPDQLVIDVNEAQVHDHRSKFAALREAVATIGCGLAINRFGSTQASLSLLASVSPDYVKLDPQFTRSLEKADAQARRHFKEIIESAQQRDIRTIAEHVEDADAMAQLWQLGVNFVQGNHVQVAMLSPSATQIDAISLV